MAQHPLYCAHCFMADQANNSTDTGAEQPAGLKAGYSPLSPGITKTLTQGTLGLLVFHKDQHKRCCLESLLTGERLCVSLHFYTELEGNSQLGAGALQSPTDTQKGLRTRDKQHCTYRTKTKPLLGSEPHFFQERTQLYHFCLFLRKKKENPKPNKN